MFYEQPDDGRPALDSSIMSTAAANTTTTSLSSSTTGRSSKQAAPIHKLSTVRPMPILSEESYENDSPISFNASQRHSTTSDWSGKMHATATHLGDTQRRSRPIHLSTESSDFHFPSNRKNYNKLKRNSSASSTKHNSSFHAHRPSILSGAGISFSQGEESILSVKLPLDGEDDPVSIVPNYASSCKSNYLQLLSYSTLLSIPDLSDEAKKWLQQYRAMFVKRFINFKRFRVGLFCQVVLPMLFVVVGLVVVSVIILVNDSDPPRSLNIRNSAPNSSNITFFLGQFGSKTFPFTQEVMFMAIIVFLFQ